MNQKTKFEILHLIDTIYVLTDKEKDQLKLKLRHADPLTTRILLNYHGHRDVSKFYQQLKEQNLLSTQNMYKNYIQTYGGTPKRTSKGNYSNTSS